MRFKVEAVLGKELTRRLVVVVVRDAPRVPSARLLEPERRTLLDQLCNCERGGGGGSARVRVHTHRADRFVQSDALGATHISDRRKYHTQKKKAASKRASDKASCGVCVWSVRVECCGVLWSVCVECVCGVCRFGREQSCVWTLFSPIQDLGQSASRALFYRSSLLLLPIFSSPFHAESIRAVKPRFDCTSMSIVSCLRRRSTSLCFLALIACVCRHTKGSHRVRPLVATFSTIE